MARRFRVIVKGTYGDLAHEMAKRGFVSTRVCELQTDTSATIVPLRSMTEDPYKVLMDWFGEDLHDPPYSAGSLLMFNEDYPEGFDTDPTSPGYVEVNNA